MHSVRRKRFAEAAQLWFAQALVFFIRAVFRVLELFGPEKRRRKLRDFRLKMNALKQEKRTALQQIKENPGNGIDVMDGFFARHGDAGTHQFLQGHRLQIQTMRQESAALQAIHTEAGDNTAEAIAGYRQYIEAHPDSHLAYSSLGGALQKIPSWDESRAAYREAVRLAGADSILGAATRLKIGKVLEAKGDTEAAITEYRSLIETTAPETEFLYALTYLQLGEALNLQGKRAEARAAWKQAIKRNGTKIVADRARELLKNNP